jgi:hypothetical protein
MPSEWGLASPSEVGLNFTVKSATVGDLRRLPLWD